MADGNQYTVNLGIYLQQVKPAVSLLFWRGAAGIGRFGSRICLLRRLFGFNQRGGRRGGCCRCGFLGLFVGQGGFAVAFVYAAHHEVIAGDDEGTDDGDQEGGQHVHLRVHAAFHFGENQLWQGGVVGAAEEGGDYQVVHGKGHGEQEAGGDGGGDQRQGDYPEDLPRLGAQILRGFFQGLVELAQAGADDYGNVGHAQGGVAEPDGEPAALELQPAQAGTAQQGLHLQNQHHQRNTGDDVGHHHRGRHHAGEQGAAAETLDARQGVGGHGAKHHGGSGGNEGDADGEPGGFQNLAVIQQRAIPFGGEAAPYRNQLGAVEGIHHQHQQRDIEEGQP